MAKIKVTGPRVQLGKKGLRIRSPRARIGGKSGLNVSKGGVSASHRGKLGTINSKRGISLKGLPGCLLPVIVAIIITIGILACGGTATPVAKRQDTLDIPSPTSQPVTIEPTDTPIPPTETPVPPTQTPAPTPTPTDMPPTQTPAPTDMPPTQTPAPTMATPSDTVGPRVEIVDVDKRAEYVDIRNSGGAAQDLAGWVLVSEKGNQRCTLGGLLEAGATLRIWAGAGQGGFSCGFDNPIWNNSEPDAAVLLDAGGVEVDRW